MSGGIQGGAFTRGFNFSAAKGQLDDHWRPSMFTESLKQVNMSRASVLVFKRHLGPMSGSSENKI